MSSINGNEVISRYVSTAYVNVLCHTSCKKGDIKYACVCSRAKDL